MNDDVIEQLRRLLGVKDSGPKTAGAIGTASTFEDRQRIYEAEMRRLAEGGADYSGAAGWKKIRRLRRG